ELDLQSDDRYQFKVEGDNQDYTVGVDIDTGETFCPCPLEVRLVSSDSSASVSCWRWCREREL
ncbi:hypothetical protein HRED_10422, partial [Candidatus Haloredivivus sp. G17]